MWWTHPPSSPPFFVNFYRGLSFISNFSVGHSTPRCLNLPLFTRNNLTFFVWKFSNGWPSRMGWHPILRKNLHGSFLQIWNFPSQTDLEKSIPTISFALNSTTVVISWKKILTLINRLSFCFLFEDGGFILKRTRVN